MNPKLECGHDSKHFNVVYRDISLAPLLSDILLFIPDYSHRLLCCSPLTGELLLLPGPRHVVCVPTVCKTLRQCCYLLL